MTFRISVCWNHISKKGKEIDPTVLPAQGFMVAHLCLTSLFLQLDVCSVVRFLAPTSAERSRRSKETSNGENKEV